MKILVTGGAGFIGSNIVRRLLERGDEVHILDNFETGKRKTIAEFASAIERCIEGDIRSPAVCRTACEGVEAVLHEAALGSVPRSMREPNTTHDVNVTGTVNMLEAARAEGVERFVFASSSSVYGDQDVPIKTEDLASSPLSPYACSKLAAEAYTTSYTHAYGMRTVALRYFNVFGPYQDPSSQYAAVVPLFADRLLAGVPPTIYGDGEQTRDFTYVDNVVEANLLALSCPPEACGQAYNVAGGSAVSVNELLRVMKERLGGSAAQVEAVYEERRKGDVLHSLASIDKARESLGYTGAVTFEEGIAKTVDWYAGCSSKVSESK